MKYFPGNIFKSKRAVEAGFTLIELLIVMTVLGILAAIIIPNVASFIISGHVAAGNAEVSSLNTALQAYTAEHGTSPGTSDSVVPNLSPWLSGATVKYAYTFGQTTGTTPVTIIVGTDGAGTQADADGLKWVDGTADGSGAVVTAGAWARTK